MLVPLTPVSKQTKRFTVAATLVAVIALAGCGETKVVKVYVPATETTATADTEPQSDDNAPSKVIAQGEAQGHDGERQKVTLLEVARLPRKRCDVDGINCVVAKRGNRMIGAKLSIKGLDGSIEECAGNSASILTSDGAQSTDVYDPYLMPQLDCFKRRRGQAITGWVTMEINRRASGLVLSWRPANGNNDTDVQWPVRFGTR